MNNLQDRINNLKHELYALDLIKILLAYTKATVGRNDEQFSPLVENSIIRDERLVTTIASWCGEVLTIEEESIDTFFKQAQKNATEIKDLANMLNGRRGVIESTNVEKKQLFALQVQVVLGLSSGLYALNMGLNQSGIGEDPERVKREVNSFISTICFNDLIKSSMFLPIRHAIAISEIVNRVNPYMLSLLTNDSVVNIVRDQGIGAWFSYFEAHQEEYDINSASVRGQIAVQSLLIKCVTDKNFLSQIASNLSMVEEIFNPSALEQFCTDGNMDTFFGNAYQRLSETPPVETLVGEFFKRVEGGESGQHAAHQDEAATNSEERHFPRPGL